jgi:hypothetical protein
MRMIAALLAASLLSAPFGGPLLLPSAAADEADDFFEVGLKYLRTGFYREARAAFSESLVRAPSEAVPTAFTALACAAEGRDSRSCAHLVRLAYRRLPAKRHFRIHLSRMLASEADRVRIERRFTKRLAESRGSNRIDNLTVLIFLQIHDGSPDTSSALETLKKERPHDEFLKSLKKSRAPPQISPKPQKPNNGKKKGKKPKEPTKGS